MNRYPIQTTEYLKLEVKKLLEKRGIVQFSRCGCGCGGIMVEMGDSDNQRTLFDTYPKGPHPIDRIFEGAVKNELVVWNERKGVRHETARD